MPRLAFRVVADCFLDRFEQSCRVPAFGRGAECGLLRAKLRDQRIRFLPLLLFLAQQARNLRCMLPVANKCERRSISQSLRSDIGLPPSAGILRPSVLPTKLNFLNVFPRL